MEAFFVSLTTGAAAEMGDRTQLLALVLAARYRKPLPIIAGILCATLANHAAAGFIGVWFGRLLKPVVLQGIVGISMIGMALWTLKPDMLSDDAAPSDIGGVFIATLSSFFLAEIGDKTQIATLALAAAYPSLLAVITGTTAGMLVANVPVVFLGKAFSGRLPMKAIHYGTAILFVILGVLYMHRALAGDDERFAVRHFITTVAVRDAVWINRSPFCPLYPTDGHSFGPIPQAFAP